MNSEIYKYILRKHRNNRVGKGLRFFHTACGYDENIWENVPKNIPVIYPSYLNLENWTLASNRDAICLAQQFYAEASGWV